MSETDTQIPHRGSWRRSLAIAAGLAIVGSLGIAFAQRLPTRHFTPTDITAITSTLREADERIYLIRTPVFRDGRIVGSKLFGALPMKDVERLAESLHIRLDKDANVIAVYDPDEGSDSGGGGGGGGGDVNEPGSMYPANGRDLSNRLDVLLKDIDASSYQFLR